VPYVFVKGNHDSPGIADAVARQPNATVLDAATPPVRVAGLRFAGMADPRFTPDKTTGDDRAAHRVDEHARHFAERLTGRVDVLVVHDPAAERVLSGYAPLLLAGHTHRRATRRVADTVILVQGSTGGAGLRGVQQDPPTPLSLTVVYLDRQTKRLWGVDELTLAGLGGVALTIERRTLGDLLGGDTNRGGTNGPNAGPGTPS
jgi:predicted phosphodiesterase